MSTESIEIIRILSWPICVILCVIILVYSSKKK